MREADGQAARRDRCMNRGLVKRSGVLSEERRCTRDEGEEKQGENLGPEGAFRKFLIAVRRSGISIRWRFASCKTRVRKRGIEVAGFAALLTYARYVGRLSRLR